MVTLSAISSRQIKAARALLDWSQEALAETSGLSIATIRKLEIGFISPRTSTMQLLRRALEKAGIEFIESDGVRRRSDEIVTYKGREGVTDFVEDILATIKKAGGDLLIVSPLMERFIAEHGNQLLDGLLGMNGSSSIKCIHTDIIDLALSTPRFEHRFISRQYVDPLPFCVYGDKMALIVSGAGLGAKIVVMQAVAAAQASRRQFFSMWDKATPFDVSPLEMGKQSVRHKHN